MGKNKMASVNSAVIRKVEWLCGDRQKAGDLPWNCLLLYEQLVCRSWAMDW